MDLEVTKWKPSKQEWKQDIHSDLIVGTQKDFIWVNRDIRDRFTLHEGYCSGLRKKQRGLLRLQKIDYMLKKNKI